MPQNVLRSRKDCTIHQGLRTPRSSRIIAQCRHLHYSRLPLPYRCAHHSFTRSSHHQTRRPRLFLGRQRRIYRRGLTCCPEEYWLLAGQLGHAERRRLFGETDVEVAKKAQAAVRNGMTPLVCIEGTKGNDSRGSRGMSAADRVHTGRDERGGHFCIRTHWGDGQANPASAEYVVDVTKELRKLCGTRRVRFIMEDLLDRAHSRRCERE